MSVFVVMHFYQYCTVLYNSNKMCLLHESNNEKQSSMQKKCLNNSVSVTCC